MEELTEFLWDLSAFIFNVLNSEEETEVLGWLPPTCPVCNTVLSSKAMSDRLICLRCNREFRLEEIAKR